jgi:two-component sensor histidine kinase
MERNLVARDLMLQEMKHRIKNSIARILAMARQTARRSPDLEAFSKSFTARLQAMANAQDMLTRSTWGRADLRALLLQELGQVFGEADDVAHAGGAGGLARRGDGPRRSASPSTSSRPTR